jgi:predicted RNase H-like HicB family nuclease
MNTVFLKTITLTFELTPESSGGFSVICLDWSSVFSEGETFQECRQNAIDVTEMYLELLLNRKLTNKQFPKIKKHLASPFTFQLTFDYDNGKYIEVETISSFKDIKPVEISY